MRRYLVPERGTYKLRLMDNYPYNYDVVLINSYTY